MGGRYCFVDVGLGTALVCVILSHGFALGCASSSERGGIYALRGDTESNIRRLGIANVRADRATLVLDFFLPVAVRVEARPQSTGPWAEPWVDYSPAGDAGRHFEIELSPLSPRTVYEYRFRMVNGMLVEADPRGTGLSFRTPSTSAPSEDSPAVSACALVISDTQGSSFTEVLGELEALRTDVDFVLSLGDQVAIEAATTPEAQELAYLDYLLGPLSTLTSHVPLMATVGNHDVGNWYPEVGRAQALSIYAQHLVLPENGPSTAPPESVYSFDWEALHVAVLDSTGPGATPGLTFVDENQLAWLSDDLAAAQGRWRIVALHHMVQGWETADTPAPVEWFHVENYERVHEAFVAAGVDLVLGGHRHSYNVFVRDGVRYVTFPTASRDQVLFGRYGAANWHNRGGEEGTLDRAVSGVFGYATLCGDETALTLDLTAYDARFSGRAPVPTAPVVFTR